MPQDVVPEVEDQVMYTVGRSPDDTVTLLIEEGDYTRRLHLTKGMAISVGKLLMGAGGYPAYQQDEPWLTLNRERTLKMQQDRK